MIGKNALQKLNNALGSAERVAEFSRENKTNLSPHKIRQFLRLPYESLDKAWQNWFEDLLQLYIEDLSKND
jgi:hypothetical protein